MLDSEITTGFLSIGFVKVNSVTSKFISPHYKATPCVHLVNIGLVFYNLSI